MTLGTCLKSGFQFVFKDAFQVYGALLSALRGMGLDERRTA